ncbi:MAG: hypothetical protein WCE38_14025, partial [Burkholderiales bacterium]
MISPSVMSSTSNRHSACASGSDASLPAAHGESLGQYTQFRASAFDPMHSLQGQQGAPDQAALHEIGSHRRTSIERHDDRLLGQCSDANGHQPTTEIRVVVNLRSCSARYRRMFDIDSVGNQRRCGIGRGRTMGEHGHA